MSLTLVEQLRNRARSFATRIALIEGSSRWTYAELFERSDRFASALHDLGVKKGDAVLAFLPNVHEAVECELAVLGSGFAWITLTARLTWAEMRGVVASCVPKVLVTNADGLARIEAGLAALPLSPLPLIVVTGTDARAGSALAPLSYEVLLASASGAREAAPVSLEEPARLRYTSGTTGSAKAAVLPHRVYLASLGALLDALGPFTPEDCALHAAPLT